MRLIELFTWFSQTFLKKKALLSRGSRNTPRHCMMLKPEISASLNGLVCRPMYYTRKAHIKAGPVIKSRLDTYRFTRVSPFRT